MKVLAGRLKGRNIQAPKGWKTRPPLEILRQMMFNSLWESLEGATVLDLFSGSGSMGIEAYSRGADHCILVEKNRKACQIILDNLKNFGVEDRFEILTQSFPQVLQHESLSEQHFDLIIADPPFDTFQQGKLMDLEEKVAPLLKEKGIFIHRIPATGMHLPEPTSLELVKVKQQGPSLMRFFKLRSA